MSRRAGLGRRLEGARLNAARVAEVGGRGVPFGSTGGPALTEVIWNEASRFSLRLLLQAGDDGLLDLVLAGRIEAAP